MSTERRYRTVIVGAVDGGDATDDIIQCAVAAARGFVGGELHFVLVAAPPHASGGTDIAIDAAIVQGKNVLAEVTRKTAAIFVGRVEAHLVAGAPARGILQLACDLEADLIVVGAVGKGRLRRHVFGSVSRAVLAGAECAVLVARPRSYGDVDDDDLEEAGQEHACRECLAVQAKSSGTRLWCASHLRRSLEPHLHYRSTDPIAVAGLTVPSAAAE